MGGFEIESEYHFLGSKVISEGKDRESYPKYNDEPLQGKLPEPKKEEKKKKGFDWGKLAKNVLVGIAVVAVAAVAIAATAGAAAPLIGAIATCAIAGGTAAVASQAISDIRRGEVSDVKAYMGAAARESIIGAISGAVFGPLGVAKTVAGRMAMGGINNAFESCIRQGLEGNGFSFTTMLLDAGVGALFAGALDTKFFKSVAGKADNMAPWIGKGMKKLNDGIEDLANRFGNKIKNSLDDLADGFGPRFAYDGPGGNYRNYRANDNQPVVKNKQQIEYMEAMEDARNGYKGGTQTEKRLTSLTKEQLKGKPKNSPNPDKWFKKNGTISIDDEGVWTYHDWEGNSVSYPDGYPDFKSAGMVEQEVNIGPFEGYNKDFPLGDELAPNGPISESSTWHHHQDGVTLQEVLTKLHERFRHRGGMSKIKK